MEHCQQSGGHDKIFFGPNTVLELLRERNLLIVRYKCCFLYLTTAIFIKLPPFSHHSSILAAVAIFVLAGTLVDIVVFSVAKSNDQRSEHSFQKSRSQFTTLILKVLRCFSLIQNTAILFGQLPKNKIFKPAETPETRIEHRLAFLHGIRVALVAWVVAAHSVALLPASIAMPVAMIARHPHDMLMLAEGSRLSSTFFNNGTLAVEAFFLIRSV